MVRVLIVDNYDSFTYNLVQELGELGAELEVVRNDAVTLDDVVAAGADGIVISPGPCTPREAGISTDVIRALGPSVPILGVCLGHQCIADVYGGRVVRAPQVVHGKTSEVFHRRKGIFAGLETPFEATRYHSLIVDRQHLPDCLEVTAETSDEIIMGLKHREYAVEGVQFHPESVMTRDGMAMLGTWLASLARPEVSA